MKVKDSAGVERDAPLFFLFHHPSQFSGAGGAGVGLAELRIFNGAELVGVGSVPIVGVTRIVLSQLRWPGLAGSFVAPREGDGQFLRAADALRRAAAAVHPRADRPRSGRRPGVPDTVWNWLPRLWRWRRER
jgi:hypothetical protein